MNFIKYGYKYQEVIAVYMAMKIKLGYEPSYTVEEITNFLDYVTSYIFITDINITCKDALNSYVQNFLEKNKDSFTVKDDGTIFPTYKFEIPNIGSIFIPGDLDYCIENFLQRNCIPRIIKAEDNVSEKTREFCENATATLLAKIWHDQMLEYINEKLWPGIFDYTEKCSENIDLEENLSITPRGYLLNFYKRTLPRMMQMASSDDFQMTNYEGNILGMANFAYIVDSDRYIRSNGKFGHIILLDKASNMMFDNAKFKTTNWAAATEIPLDSPDVLSLNRTIKMYLKDR